MRVLLCQSLCGCIITSNSYTSQRFCLWDQCWNLTFVGCHALDGLDLLGTVPFCLCLLSLLIVAQFLIACVDGRLAYQNCRMHKCSAIVPLSTGTVAADGLAGLDSGACRVFPQVCNTKERDHGR